MVNDSHWFLSECSINLQNILQALFSSDTAATVDISVKTIAQFNQ